MRKFLKAGGIMTALLLCALLVFAPAVYAADAPEGTTRAVSPCGSFGGGAPAQSGGEGAAPAGGPQQEGGLMSMMFPLIVFIFIFYFFIIRPQKKREKQHSDMVSAIGRGDKIITIGGFYGKVKEVRDDKFIVDIGAGENEVRVCLSKGAIQTKVSDTPQQSDAKKD